jgi:RNA methyltransferase, TrmH family
MQFIESKQNRRFKNWKKLHTKKGRSNQHRFFIEGEHLVQEAMRGKWTIEEWILSEHYSGPLLQHIDPSVQGDRDRTNTGAQNSVLTESRSGMVFRLPDPLFRDLSATEEPQGIAAIVRQREEASYERLLEEGKLLLLVDNVRDPGNLGTILRTADAAGADAVFLNNGTVDPYSDKVVRATQGSLFHIPFFQVALDTLLGELKQAEWTIWGTGLSAAIDYRTVESAERRQAESCARYTLIVGNEAHGVHPTLLNQTDVNVTIPIFGRAESLNVAVATGILLYHVKMLQSPV